MALGFVAGPQPMMIILWKYNREKNEMLKYSIKRIIAKIMIIKLCVTEYNFIDRV